MLDLWGMRSTPSLPSLPGPFWPGVVPPDSVLCKTELFEIELFFLIELICVLVLN